VLTKRLHALQQVEGREESESEEEEDESELPAPPQTAAAAPPSPLASAGNAVSDEAQE